VLAKGKPVNVDGSYAIVVGLKHAPVGTDRVEYEIADGEDTFDITEWSVRKSARNFDSEIDSYGDILLIAKGKGKAGTWRVESTLYSALKNSYSNTKRTTAIRASLKQIKEN